MKIEVRQHVVRVMVVKPEGRLDAFSAPELRALMDAQLEAGTENVVFDLSATTFLDSAGMAVLVSVLKRTRQGGGDTRLVWPAEEAARRILRLTRFDRVFEWADDAAAVLKLF